MHPSPLPRRGLTLIEMLISLACVILLMLAYTQLFAEAGSRISDARANIDLTNRLRSAVTQLRNEFTGATAEMVPWQRPERGGGCFEIIEGPLSDASYSPTLPYRHNGITLNDPATSEYDETLFPFSDTDDVLMFTVRSKGAPFVGKYLNSPVQSETALVVWFLRPTMNINPAALGLADLPVSPQTFTLYRRVFLVKPTDNSGAPIRIDRTAVGDIDGNGTAGELADLWCANDVSLRYESPTIHVANTLADLTKRENRFAHHPTTFPHLIDPLQIVPFGGEFSGGNYRLRTTHPRYGEDVVLTNVLGFDVQVWDPNAPLKADAAGTVALGPGDPGYSLPPAQAPPTGTFGAYVDLNWGRNLVPVPWFPVNSSRTDFQTIGHPLSRLIAGNIPLSLEYGKTWLFYDTGDSSYIQPATYDLWSFSYEHDGIDQDGDGAFDEGTDGFDTDGQYGVDDTGYVNPTTGAMVSLGERETSPPYPAPLRGIKVRIRVYEPDTRQIREVSVVHSFVPE